MELEAGETSLIIVDMQNDFADERGSLYVPDTRKTIKPIKSLLQKSRKSGVTVIYTQDWHREDDPEFRIWGRHAVAGSWGAEIIEELKPLEGEIIIKKERYDGFYQTNLEKVLREKKIKNLIITGTVANICVLHTAGSAALRGFKVVVPVDCISALNEFDYISSLRQISFLYRGELTKSDLIKFR